MEWKNISDHKMVATQSFQHILQQIQQSSLNFQIKLSPFSAEISLKKSLIKDLDGSAMISQFGDVINQSDFSTKPVKEEKYVATENNEILLETIEI